MNPSNKPPDPDISDFRSREGLERFLSEAEALIEEGLHQEAFSLARERLTLFPGDVDARLICGRALAAMGKTLASLDIFRDIKKDLQNWVRILERMGDIFRASGDMESAEACYREHRHRSGDLLRRDASPRKMESQGGRREGQEGELIDNLSGSFKTMTMADLYIKQGHLDMAKRVLEEMMRSDPGSRKAAERLGEVEALLRGRGPIAEEAHSKAILQELDRWLKNLERRKSHE